MPSQVCRVNLRLKKSEWMFVYLLSPMESRLNMEGLFKGTTGHGPLGFLGLFPVGHTELLCEVTDLVRNL